MPLSQSAQQISNMLNNNNNQINNMQSTMGGNSNPINNYPPVSKSFLSVI